MLRKCAIKCFAAVLISVILLEPAQAYAWWGRPSPGRQNHSYRVRQPYPVHGRSVPRLPYGFLSFVLGGLTYYYWEGIFYQKRTGSYAVVAPPAGIILETPPAGCDTIVVNGVTYYRGSDTYYRRVPAGYVVVEKPPKVIYVR